MSFTMYVRGKEVTVFMHNLQVYVLLPACAEERAMVMREEKDILAELKEEFGRELKEIRFYTPLCH